MKKLNITFCSYPDFASNAKPLYEYMKNRYEDSMNYTWIVYNEETVTLLKEKGINAILIGTDEFWKYVPKTDVFFTTQGNLDRDKTDKSIYVELWHGIGPKPTGFSGDHPSELDVTGYNHMRKIFDYVIVPNDFWKIVFSAKLYVQCNRIKSLGMPIFDYFENSKGKDNIEKILKINTKKYKKLIIYMPTFKQGFNHNDVENININNIFNFNSYDESKLDEYLKKNNYLLCVKRHVGEVNKFKEYETDNIKNINEDMLIKNNLSVNEILNGFDMLITDYSSIGTEFLYFNRPLLYAVNDENEYLKNRGILFSNFDFWTIGPKVKNIDDLIKETDKLLKDDNYYSEERERAKKLFISENKNNCKNICDFLFEGNKISKNVKHYKDPEKMLEKEVETLNYKLKNTEEQLLYKKSELNNIVNSKGWKFLEKIRKIRRCFKSK